MKVDVLKTNGLANKDIYIVFLEIGKKEDLADLPKPLNVIEKELYDLCKEKFNKPIEVVANKTINPIITKVETSTETNENEVVK